MVDYDVRYRKGWAYGKLPSSFLVEVAAAHLPARAAPLDILSLGEGQGRHVVHLASLGHRCVGVDQSHVGLAKARSLAAERGVGAWQRFTPTSRRLIRRMPKACSSSIGTRSCPFIARSRPKRACASIERVPRRCGRAAWSSSRRLRRASRR